MDLLNNTINRRFMSGSFPAEKLFSVPIDNCHEIDFEKEAAEGLLLFEEHPEIFNIFFLICRDRVQELEKMHMPELYSQEINCYINTKYHPDSFNIVGVIQDAYNLCPVVTPLDKILWMGASLYHFDGEFIKAEKVYDPQKMMLTWIYLLLITQKKELDTRKTINVDAVDIESNVVSIIFKEWNDDKQSDLIPLTKQQIHELSVLMDKKSKLSEKAHEEMTLGKEKAKKTNAEWMLFLNLLNDLAEKESNVISSIIDEDSSISDKRRAISEYRIVLRTIERGKYDLNGTELNLLDVLDAVKERMETASYYSSARVEDGLPFRVHPAAFGLVIEPHTYNYLLMTFHEFRLSPSKETAKQFVSLALSYIKKNLEAEETTLVSIDDMIEDFASTVFSFVDNNKAAINRLSFNKVQNDAIATDGTSRITQETDLYSDKLTQFINEYQNSKRYDKEIEAIIEGHGRIFSEEELRGQIGQQEEVDALTEKEALSQQLIYSLNIIYLFCDALRIMLNNKHANVKIKKREQASKIRGKLLDLDADLVHTVYSEIRDDELNMREYREQTGVISTHLSEQEYQEELFRSTVCFGILKDAVIELVSHIKDKSVEEIMDAKTRIKKQIQIFPDFESKGTYVEWLDSISTKICNALIDNCQKKEEEYTQIKHSIFTSLGEKSVKLPASTIDSLTTAEMLYGNYATDEFAERGFDFSCISALYYQAFEDAYNGLIWKGYAEKLNILEINGIPYTSILKRNRKKALTEPESLGYLHKDNWQRNYYVQFPSKEKGITTTSVSLRCMYMSFAILMESINPSSELDKYCDYFAEITGFDGKNQMFLDKSFMDKCMGFTKAIKESAGNRNNASHGGTFISKEQCVLDKKTVLNDLETVRSTSIGLVQQLLYILYRD